MVHVSNDLKLRMVQMISNLAISQSFTLAAAEFDELALMKLEVDSIHRQLLKDNPED